MIAPRTMVVVLRLPPSTRDQAPAAATAECIVREVRQWASDIRFALLFSRVAKPIVAGHLLADGRTNEPYLTFTTLGTLCPSVTTLLLWTCTSSRPNICLLANANIQAINTQRATEGLSDQ